MNKNTYVGYLSSDSYLPGILFLQKNLKLVQSKYPLIVLVTDNLSKKTYSILEKNKIKYKIIKKSNLIAPDNLNKETRWNNTFDKIEIFNLLEYDRCIYLDCDLLILDNIDNLFNLTNEFITGTQIQRGLDEEVIYENPRLCAHIMIYTPNDKLYNTIKNLMNTIIPTNGGDEYYIYMALNTLRKNITCLPYEYGWNLLSKIPEEMKVLFKISDNKFKIKIAHFCGELKPWDDINYFKNNLTLNPIIKNMYLFIYNQLNIS